MRSRLAAYTVAVCLISTIAAAQHVSVNYNHNQSFAQYATYAWGKQ